MSSNNTKKTGYPSDGRQHDSAGQVASERDHTLLGLNLDSGLSKEAVPAGSSNDALAAQLDAMTPDDTIGLGGELGRERSGSVQMRKLVDKDDPWHGLSGAVADVKKKCNDTGSQTVNKSGDRSRGNGK